jgi:hypothetical protein
LSVQTILAFFMNHVLKFKYQPGCLKTKTAWCTFYHAFCCLLAVNGDTVSVHTGKAYRGSGGTSPPILNLVVSITLSPYSPDTERVLSARCIEGWTEPTGSLDLWRIAKPVASTRIRTPDPPTRSQKSNNKRATTPTADDEVWRSQLRHVFSFGVYSVTLRSGINWWGCSVQLHRSGHIASNETGRRQWMVRRWRFDRIWRRCVLVPLLDRRDGMWHGRDSIPVSAEEKSNYYTNWRQRNCGKKRSWSVVGTREIPSRIAAGKIQFPVRIPRPGLC